MVNVRIDGQIALGISLEVIITLYMVKVTSIFTPRVETGFLIAAKDIMIKNKRTRDLLVPRRPV